MRKKKVAAGIVISNNTIKMEPFVLDPQMAASIQKLAEACASNARAIQVIAEKLAGPPQYGMYFDTHE